MTPYNHLTTEELLSLARFRPRGAAAPTAMEIELTDRLEAAYELNQETEHNLALLAAKYGITEDDLTECVLEAG